MPELKFEITKSSIESANASSARGDDPRHDQRQGHRPERRERARPEVARRLLERAVEADQPRPDDDHDERDREHHVGDHQASGTRVDEVGERRQQEHREQRRADHDLRASPWDHDQEVRRLRRRRTRNGPAPARSACRARSRADRDTAASSRLVIIASFRSSISNGFFQWSSVKPSQVKLNRPCGLVEGEDRDDHRDRDQHVGDGDAAVDHQRVLADPLHAASASSPISASRPGEADVDHDQREDDPP